MTESSRLRILQALLGGALLAAAACAGAREVRMQGPNGDSGTCPDAVAQDDQDPAPAPHATRRQSAPEKPKATPMVRSGGDATTARPRWHSILPGMFR